MARQGLLIFFCTFALILVGLSNNCLAVDPSVYWGSWISRTSNTTIKLAIDKETINLEIHGKTFRKPKTSFVYGDSAVYPFLFIHSSVPSDRKDSAYYSYEHSLYLIIGGSGKEELSIMRGFYEYSKVRNDHDGTIESMSLPVEFSKIDTHK